MELAIDVMEVTKRYGDFVAVDRVSLRVPRGSVFGILGPNGAGKTTTIRMIMNITIPDSGAIRILGQPSTEVARGAIGYLPEERGLYRRMKVLDHLVFLGEIRGLSPRESKRRAERWLETLTLSEWKHKKVEELSKGMQQKVQFIGTVIHDPETIILDEPFSGLDPVNARTLKDQVLGFRAQGRTVILSTHVMEQAEKLCDEIALINRSHVVLSGKLQDVKRSYSGNAMEVTVRGSAECLREIRGVKTVTIEGPTALVELEPGFEQPEFLREATQRCAIESAVRHERSLDEIFIGVVSGELAVGAAA